MRSLTLLGLLLIPATATAKRPRVSTVMAVPSIAEVVEKEGFVPTPSQSEVYRPGAVLVPNDRGGHDVVVEDCVQVVPTVSIMSQSSIATSLSAGVSARFVAARGAVSAGVEKRLSFVDPEQRTISFAKLDATEACQRDIKKAGRFVDLSQAILLHDVLVAQIQNTVCTKADASGKVVLLGEAEAAAYSECVQESDAQVPLGYKAVALSQVLSVASSAPPSAPPAPAQTAPARVVPGTPAQVRSDVNFGAASDLGVSAKLKQQGCEREAQDKGAQARAARLAETARGVKAKARTAWRAQRGELESCTRLARAERGQCIVAVTAWLRSAKAMSVVLPAGVEPVQTACGLQQPAFAKESQTVTAEDLDAALALLKRLNAPDAPSANLPVGGGTTVGGASSGGVPNSVGMRFVQIPAGSFVMGCTREQGSDCEDREKPAHKVTLTRSFYMQTTEVTQGQWKSVMGSNPSSFSSCGDTCPVEQVSWDDAVAFAEKLSAKEGLRGGSAYRLPTEAEWEYAARAGQGTKYAGSNSLAAVAWYDGNSGSKPHPVGQKSPNAWGLYDMSGNVWEWTADWYGGYSSGNTTNPEGASSGTYRVIRGGSWFNSAAFARVAFRFFNLPVYRYYFLGFRLVRTIP